MRLLSAVAIAALLYAPIPGTAETGVGSDEIVVGSCIPLSGAAKDLGETELAGARAYLDYVNKEKNGVFGRRIRLIALDDKYDPEEAITCFKKLQDQGIFAAAFFSGAPTGVKYTGMAESSKTPLVGFASGLDLLYKPFKRYVFSVRATYSEESSDEAEHLWDLGVRKLAIAYQNDALGAWLKEGAVGTWSKHGAVPVAEAAMERNSLKVDTAVDTLRSSNAQAVLVYVTYSAAAELVKKATALGWRPLFVQSPGRDVFIRLAGKAADGVVWASLMPPTDDPKRPAAALYRAAMKKYAPKTEAGSRPFEGFIHAMILVEGLRRAGPQPTREMLVDGIESLHDDTLGLGDDYRLKFSPTDHQGFNRISYVVVRRGRLKPLDWSKLTLDHP